jgi:hypothetical protein
MSQDALILVCYCLAAYAVGYLLLWLAGWTLPPPASLSERVRRVFWKYPSSIEQWRINRFHIALFAIVIVTYVFSLTIFHR